jgi:hypothetical protein
MFELLAILPLVGLVIALIASIGSLIWAVYAMLFS